MASQPRCVESDRFGGFDKGEDEYDLIICNPPFSHGSIPTRIGYSKGPAQSTGTSPARTVVYSWMR
uniref:Uncharacterized protein n=1 Tax=Candidatus Kentrum sp. TC TaxID=2126339 RepID=A0A450Z289_9GAMM|nr:MAG: hypothetical protein BECKTC1821D_GA0114238_105310 [Candidatus Kentron sp. TC]